jgi:hypothetical protein
MAAGETLTAEERRRAQQRLDELEMSADEYVEQLSDVAFEEQTPPDAADVAARALAVGGLLQRLVIEQGLRGKQLSAKEAEDANHKLLTWLEAEGLFPLMETHELELLETEVGAWHEDDRRMATWTSEELAMLAWALELTDAPPADQPVELARLFKVLPLLQRTGPFLEKAHLRDDDEVAAMRERAELWAYRAEQEAVARAVLSGKAGDELDQDALIEDLRDAGYDVKGQERKLGREKMIAGGIRHLALTSAQELAAEGQLALLEGDLPFRGKPFHAAADKDVEMMSALTGARSRGLEWLVLGPGGSGLWDEGGELADDEA